MGGWEAVWGAVWWCHAPLVLGAEEVGFFVPGVVGANCGKLAGVLPWCPKQPTCSALALVCAAFGFLFV